MNEKQKWIVVAVYATAMAWVESAAVVYLRTLIDRVEPFQRNPLPTSFGFGSIEAVREASTIIMLFTVGWLAGRTWRSRVGYFAITFGIWDIFYYIFLVPTSGWPRSPFEWDILFLLPLPWWGPVIAPVLIAAMMVLGGTLISHFDRPDRPLWPRLPAWGLGVTGVLLALYVFMADAIRALGEGVRAVRDVLPTVFHWPLFILALALLAAPILDMALQLWGRRVEVVAERIPPPYPPPFTKHL